MKNTISEKYNIILIILLFIIPILTLNLSYLLIAKIEYNFAQKEQKRKALKETEILASEADFSKQFSSLFRKYLIKTKDLFESDEVSKEAYSENLDKNADIVFSNFLPSNYKLYLFKITPKTKNTELIFFKGDNKIVGKKGLCNAFDYLYQTNLGINKNISKKFTSNLLGEFTNIDFIAKEKRGLTTISNGTNKNSWFVWDYYEAKDSNTYGMMLFCNDIINYPDYGRIIALNNLKKRGKAIGAFIPLYKDFGKAIMPNILKKSDSFNEYANKLTINDLKNANYWLKNSFIQGQAIGNYNAYCYLERGDSHIAVILVKSLKKITWPKWLVLLNELEILVFFVFAVYVVIFKNLPQISLRLRFVLSYFLASILPLSLICITTYGYLLQFQNTSIERETSNLQSVLKSFDLIKTDLIKKYRATFVKALNDEKLNKIIQEKGIHSEGEPAAKRVIEIFEDKQNYYLPILGVMLIDENKKTGFLRGGASSTYNIESYMNGFLSAEVKGLRAQLNLDINNKEDETNYETNLVSIAFSSIMGTNDLGKGMAKHTSLPMETKNGDFITYHIFDYINIGGKPKYILSVIWDNETLDNVLIQDSFDNQIVNNRKQNFIAYKVSGQNVDLISKKTRHLNKEIIDKTTELARFSYNVKKTDILYDEKDLFVAMPSLRFNKTVFIGWKSKFDINIETEFRQFFMLSLVLFSIAILWICSLRSVAVFLKPISSLKKALDEVSLGNYNIGFENIPENELGTLSNEYTNMIDGLREKERLSKLISEQAVKALEKNTNGVLNNTETFKGVALVSDIRNFTGMSEKYDPTLITDLLNEHFAEMTKIISENGGYIYKFIGDAIEAVFPDNSEFVLSAYERAFKAGCLMISQLDIINISRLKRNLFAYKIGVGLCSGEMYSGSVGSIETRLDYAILGTPLKNAAKYEALSIQNPSFPLVIDETIAKKNTKLDFSLKSIDNKEQNYVLYSIDGEKEEIINKINNKFIKNDSLTNKKENKINEKAKLIEYFSLYNEKKDNSWSSNLLTIFILIVLSSLITFGFYSVYFTSYKNAKDESDKVCSRLIEQLKSEDVFKSAFEALCFEFYDNLYEIIENNNTENFNEKIKNICEKYKQKNIPIPKVCCLLFKNFKKKGTYDCKRKNQYLESSYNHGFFEETFNAITDYAISLRLLDYDNRNIYFKKFMGDISPYYMRSIYYRRSAEVFLENENIYFTTNMIFNKNRDNFKAYVFCGIPTNLDKNLLIEYYKLLAGKDVILAFNKENVWKFSDNFPQKQQDLLINYSSNIKKLKEIGYSKDEIKIGKDTWNVYCISKELASIYHSKIAYILFIFFISTFLLGIIFYFIKIKNSNYTKSISSKLNIYIFSAAILPLLSVSFLSSLYLKEDYTVKKSEIRYDLNQLMEEIERKELYYQPFFDNFLRKTSNEDLPNKLKNIDKEKIENYIDENIAKHNIFRKNDINPHISVRETIIFGKNDYNLTVRYVENKKVTELSKLAKLFKELIYVTYLKDKSSQETINPQRVMISEQLLETLASFFGNDFAIKIINCPYSLNIVSVSFSFAGIYIAPFPNIEKPDYIFLYLLFFDNELRPESCKMHNMGDLYHYAQNEKDEEIYKKDNNYPFEKRFKSDYKTGKLYCFQSPNVNVGEYYFFEGFHINDNLYNKREDLKAVKELCLASSWINSSFSPISRKIDLYGPVYLEMKRGDILKDNIYAAIASEYPLNQDSIYKKYMLIGIITLSIIMILIIIKIVTSDLLEPVKILMIGAKLASKGDYSFRIVTQRNDELGKLCDSFNKMMKGLEEKLLMNRMVSKTALSVSSNNIDTLSKKEDVFLLYVTVPEFDKIMKNTNTLELFAKLKNQISTIAEIVINKGGDIDKIMGEKLLIVFHVKDKKLEELACSVCKAAKDIENCKDLNFKVAVGVNYGQVISGFLGVGEKRDFTVIGDPVNVTARIAVFAEKLEDSRRIVSEKIMHITKEIIQMEEIGEVLFKGKSKSSKVYKII